MAVMIFVVTGRRIGLRQRFTMQESIGAPALGGIVRLTRFIFKGVLLFESWAPLRWRSGLCHCWASHAGCIMRCSTRSRLSAMQVLTLWPGLRARAR